MNPCQSKINGPFLASDATELRCNLLAGHSGKHSYHVEWTDPIVYQPHVKALSDHIEEFIDGVGFVPKTLPAKEVQSKSRPAVGNIGLSGNIKTTSDPYKAKRKTFEPDREPQMSDGPDYHEEHRAWKDRQKNKSFPGQCNCIPQLKPYGECPIHG